MMRHGRFYHRETDLLARVGQRSKLSCAHMSKLSRLVPASAGGCTVTKRSLGSRLASRRFPWTRSSGSLALVCLLLGALGQATTRASEGRLAELYQQFLSGSNSQRFVAFERTIIFPRGRKPPAPVFMSFCRKDASYIIAVSRDVAATNIDNLASADKLHGFDGENYWSMRLDSPVRVYPKPDKEGQSPPPLENSFNTLRVIPKAEVSHEQGRYQSDPGFNTISALAAECTRVVQFGFVPIEGRPRVVGSDLVVTSAEGEVVVTAHLTGHPDQPAGLSYLVREAPAVTVCPSIT